MDDAADANQIYLNHAGTSWPKPQVVSQAVTAAMQCCPSKWPELFEHAHRSLANYFGVETSEQLVLTPGCTSSLATALSDVSLDVGKRILTSRWEHHGLHRPLVKRSEQNIRLQYIPVTESQSGGRELLDLNWLEIELRRADVGLVALTAACNVTGELLPYQEVINLAHRHGAMVLLDAAQIVGWQPLNLTNLNADFVAFGGHKGLQAPWGIGGLYQTDRARVQCVSATCELPTTSVSSEHAPARPGYCDVGSVDQFALAGLHAAIEHIDSEDATDMLIQARQQVDRLQKKLSSFPHVQIAGTLEMDRKMPTVAFNVSGISSGEFSRHLAGVGITASSGLQCAPLAHEALESEETGLVRLSVGRDQPDSEIESACERLENLLRSGR